MKTIIAGSRGITDCELLEKTITLSGFTITEVVSGTCPDSPDELGERWAEAHSIPVKQFPANWKRFGRRAGPLRNAEMAEYAAACIVLWDGDSRGSAGMAQLAVDAGLQVYVWNQKTGEGEMRGKRVNPEQLSLI